MILEISILCILLILSAIFSATETAFISLSIVQIEECAAKHGRKGKRVKKLLENTNTLLTTILIGNNLVNISASAIATHVTIEKFGSKSIGITTGILTLVILIFAEVTPKQIAIMHNEQISLCMSSFIRFLEIVLFPVIKLIGFISSLLTRLFQKEQKESISMDSILHMIRLAEHEGVVESYESKMVKNVFRFNDTPIQAIMTHRREVFSLDRTLTLRVAIDSIIEKGFSRIPVYHENPEDIVGIVLLKDVISSLAKNDTERQLKEIMVKPLFASGNRKVNELFTLFKSEKLNIAVIVDGYGGLLGIVTMEDITEELFGELYDENEEKGMEKITKIDDTAYRILGDTPVQFFNDRFESSIPYSKNARTLAGYLVEYLGNIPVQGQKIKTPFGDFTIESVLHNRINSVILTYHNR